MVFIRVNSCSSVVENLSACIVPTEVCSCFISAPSVQNRRPYKNKTSRTRGAGRLLGLVPEVWLDFAEFAFEQTEAGKRRAEQRER
jgi:hypothetical protein